VQIANQFGVQKSDAFYLYSELEYQAKYFNMKLREKAKLRKLLRLKDFFALHHVILSALPNYTVFYNEFSSLLSSILAQITLQSVNKKGIIDAKREARQNLSTMIEDVANRVNTYSMIINDSNLFAQTKLTSGALKRMSEINLFGAGRAIYNCAQEYLPSLAVYGLNAAFLNNLQVSIDTFLSFIPKPEEGISDTKQNTQKISDLFKAEDVCIAKIEAIMRLIKFTDPHIFRDFLDAKHETIKGRQKLAAKLKVYDEKTTKGLQSCVLKFTRILDEKNQAVTQAIPILKKTYKQGGGYIKSMPKGTYDVNVRCTGYMEKNLQMVINGNELVFLKIGLQQGVS